MMRLFSFVHTVAIFTVIGVAAAAVEDGNPKDVSSTSYLIKLTNTQAIIILVTVIGAFVGYRYYRRRSPTSSKTAVKEPISTLPLQGTIGEIIITSRAGDELVSVKTANAVANVGLQTDDVKDRYSTAQGTFDSFKPGTSLTLIDGAVVDELKLGHRHRRNIVTRGINVNLLVGRKFMIGDVECFGQRLCEPCEYLNKLHPDFKLLKTMIRRGGLRADIVTDGKISVGDVIATINEPNQQEMNNKTD